MLVQPRIGPAANAVAAAAPATIIELILAVLEIPYGIFALIFIYWNFLGVPIIVLAQPIAQPIALPNAVVLPIVLPLSIGGHGGHAPMSSECEEPTEASSMVSGDQDAETLGFAGTAGREISVTPCGLTTLARAELGAGPGVPMLPASWGSTAD